MIARNELAVTGLIFPRQCPQSVTHAERVPVTFVRSSENNTIGRTTLSQSISTLHRVSNPGCSTASAVRSLQLAQTSRRNETLHTNATVPINCRLPGRLVQHALAAQRLEHFLIEVKAGAERSAVRPPLML